jgi:death on curing protein
VTDYIWLVEAVVCALHDEQLAEHRGGSGIRDQGLLESAMARPKQRYAYGDNPSLFELAADYVMGIVKNHPFIDGNKRVGFIAGILFLELNGYRFSASEEDAANIIIAVAAGQVDEAGLVRFLVENSSKNG